MAQDGQDPGFSANSVQPQIFYKRHGAGEEPMLYEEG